MLSRSEQLEYEIKNFEIEAEDAIETMIEIDAYELIVDIAINLKMTKDERNYLIANIDKSTNARFIGPFLEILEDEDEMEHFISMVLDRGFDKPLVGMAMVNRRLNRNLFNPVIKLMAGRSSEYVMFISMLLEQIKDVTEEEFKYFYENTSTKDFANIISDKGVFLADKNMKQAFHYAVEMVKNNPPASGLIMNVIDIHKEMRKWSFRDEFDEYMYGYTGKDEYLPQAAKDMFLF